MGLDQNSKYFHYKDVNTRSSEQECGPFALSEAIQENLDQELRKAELIGTAIPLKESE